MRLTCAHAGICLIIINTWHCLSAEALQCNETAHCLSAAHCTLQQHSACLQQWGKGGKEILQAHAQQMSLQNTNTSPADEFAKYKYKPGIWLCQIQIHAQQMTLPNTNIYWTRPADEFAKYRCKIIGCGYCFGHFIIQNITRLHIWEPLHAAYKCTVCFWYEGAHVNCVWSLCLKLYTFKCISVW